MKTVARAITQEKEGKHPSQKGGSKIELVCK
jgi:hypothetical protein